MKACLKYLCVFMVFASAAVHAQNADTPKKTDDSGIGNLLGYMKDLKSNTSDATKVKQSSEEKGKEKKSDDTPKVIEALIVNDRATWQGSIMFESDKLSFLNRARERYLRKSRGLAMPDDLLEEEEVKSLDDIIGKEEDPTAPVQEVVPPVIVMSVKAPLVFLGTIVQADDNKWSIWLNRVRMRAGQTYNDEITAISVTDEKAKLSWKPKEEFDRLLEVWMPKLTLVKEGLYVVSNNDDITVDASAKLVNFIMSQNQTFNGARLTITEGVASSSTNETVQLLPPPSPN